MCFLHKHAKCRFWANFVPTCEYKTSCDLATDFRKLGIKRCVRLERKKLMKRCVAICSGREAVTDFVQGDQIAPPPPPPPVMIWLKGNYEEDRKNYHGPRHSWQWQRNRMGQWPPPPPPLLALPSEVGHVGQLPPTHNVNVEKKIGTQKNVSESPFSGLAHPLSKLFRRRRFMGSLSCRAAARWGRQGMLG